MVSTPRQCQAAATDGAAVRCPGSAAPHRSARRWGAAHPASPHTSSGRRAKAVRRPRPAMDPRVPFRCRRQAGPALISVKQNVRY